MTQELWQICKFRVALQDDWLLWSHLWGSLSRMPTEISAEVCLHQSRFIFWTDDFEEGAPTFLFLAELSNHILWGNRNPLETSLEVSSLLSSCEWWGWSPGRHAIAKEPQRWQVTAGSRASGFRKEEQVVSISVCPSQAQLAQLF